jgi:hypothetical protein
MARIETDPNYNSPTFSRATAPTDIFKKEDVQNVAAAFSTHTHDGSGKGLAVAFTGVPPGSIPGTALADGAVTSVKIADGTIATVDIANAAVTNAKLASDTDRSNLLTNGGFEIWQRGNGPFTANGAYNADRWLTNIAGTDTFSISKTTASADIPSGSTAAASVAFTLGTGAGGSVIAQVLKSSDLNQIRGRTVSFSMRVWANMANGVRLTLYSDGTGGASANSSFHAGNSAYATLSVTATIPNDATFVEPLVAFAASGTAFLDNAMLVVGSQYADYAPMHPADDLARCLRYYQTLKVGARLFATASGQTAWAVFPYKTRLAAIPTIGYQTAELSNNLQAAPTALGVTVDGAVLNVVSNAAGDTYWEGPITLEANP